MSRTRATEPLLRDLAADLAAVEPIPSLRSAAALALAVFVAAVGVYWSVGGPLPLGPDAPLWSNPGFVGVLAGLAISATGALTLALSSAVPGRAGAALIGRRLSGIGLVLTTGAALVALAGPSTPGAPMPMEASLACLVRACAVGAAPVLVVCGYLGRGSPRSSFPAAALAVLGGVALGAAIVHAGCAYTWAPHMLLGHALAPVAAALVGAPPLALMVSALLRRGASV